MSFLLLSFYTLFAQQITWQNCTNSGCKSQSGSIVLDKGWSGGLSAAGVTVSGDSVSQKFKTGNTVGSRIYLLDNSGNNYVKFVLINSELTFDIEIGSIPCGMNAAIYTVEMPADGGGNARGGGGYCDANYVGGEGCAEFDIGESNAFATMYTAHGCRTTGHGPKGQIDCDTSGGAANPYKVDKNLYGNGSSFKIDTSKKFTVVTQFKGSGTSLTSVDRIFIQEGKQVPEPNNVTNLSEMSKSLALGHVLVWSLWADNNDMSWLDAGENGPCNASNESSSYLQQNYPNATVKYSNLRFGELNSTF